MPLTIIQQIFEWRIFIMAIFRSTFFQPQKTFLFSSSQFFSQRPSFLSLSLSTLFVILFQCWELFHDFGNQMVSVLVDVNVDMKREREAIIIRSSFFLDIINVKILFVAVR